jgi:DNA-binding GntR family transcriptional regulator
MRKTSTLYSVHVTGEARPAKYRQVADDLRTRILSGEYPPGSAIPSMPAMTRGYGVSMTTVTDAVRVLRGEGLLRAEQGSGTFVSDPLPAPGAGSTTQDRLRLLEARMRAVEERLGLAPGGPRPAGDAE